MRDHVPTPTRVALAAGVVLVAVGAAAPYLRSVALVVVAVVAVVLVIVVARGGLWRALGTVVAATFLTENIRADWRAIWLTLAGLVAVAAVAFAPASWWLLVTILGLGLVSGALTGVSTRLLQASGRVRGPRGWGGVPDTWGDRWAAYRFRRAYTGGRHPIAHELSWDRDRKGATDRTRVPHLVEARVKAGTWTLVFITRGDWDEARWETEAHAMRRHLDGRSVHVSHQGRRTVLTIHTASLPAPGEVTVTDVPRITERGVLLGHDAARREVRWAASEAVPHGLVVGATGGGKSVLCSLILLQAAATPGWEAVMLDGKQTVKWLWLQDHGVKVIRHRDAIHEYIAWLESDRQRVEELGAPEVTRLVVLDEARFIIGKRPGPSGKQNQETSTIVGDLTGLGRSAGLRMLLVIQRPDVDEIGGGYTRSNLAFRAALGALDGDGGNMVFGDYTVSPQELGVLDSTPGRAVVAGVGPGDRDGHALQVPLLALPERAVDGGGGVPACPDPPGEPPSPPAASRRTELMDLVASAVPGDGEVRLTVLARNLGVPVDTTFRRAVRDLEAQGVVRLGRGPRGAVTVSAPTVAGHRATRTVPPAAGGVAPT